MPRKTNYELLIKDRLEKIQEYARNGLTNKEIAGLVGIAESTFYAYLNQHPEFEAALVVPQLEADSQVISSIFRSAIGYEVIEEHIEYIPDKNAKKSGQPKIKSVKKVKKWIKPNMLAAAMWIYNRRRSHWKLRQPELPPIDPMDPEFEKFSDSDLSKLIEEGLKKYKSE